ncbi:MAG: metal ABC transporter permease [Verrucomicrobiota bacterium JB024]|nr:metal ABC transporter permease [Verrucomicrobiota bacterium JB024]
MDWLTEPFSYAFLQKALAAVLLAGLNCALVGTYVVLRRMAFLGGALGHTILPGVAFAFLKGFSLFFGALGASLATALGVAALSSQKRVREDTAIGVVLAGMFALGILLMSMASSYRDFESIVFGSVLGVTSADLMIVAAVTVLIIVVLALWHKELELTSLDPEYARVIGIEPNRMRLLVLLLASLAVVSAVQVVGALLTIALLITPAACAALIMRSVSGIMVLSSAVAVFSGFAGLLLSYHFDVSSGACIVLVATGCFLLVWCYRFLRPQGH